LASPTWLEATFLKNFLANSLLAGKLSGAGDDLDFVASQPVRLPALSAVLRVETQRRERAGI